MFGLGCFWGAEKKFWQLPGVYTTAVGYAAGVTPNPTYREVCSGMTGHTEVVLVVFDPKQDLVRGSAEGVLGEPRSRRRACARATTSARSIAPASTTTTTQQRERRSASRDAYQQQLTAAGYGAITTEILPAPEFYYAEDYHQQYLAKNPGRLLRPRRHRRVLPGGSGQVRDEVVRTGILRRL